ncbi:MAG TPA: bifunctional aspartate kinase/diaminopimelate decarboxylase [Gammaproteobacteria bacterium]
MSEQEQNSWIVMKLGGTSVSKAAWWDNAAKEIRAAVEDNHRVLVVQSALTGVTDLLEKLLFDATDAERDATLAEIENRHRALADEMGIGVDLIAPRLERLKQQALGAALTSEVTPRLRAEVLAAGELMASELGRSYLERSGVNVHWQDARELLHAVSPSADNPQRHFLNATCDAKRDAQLRERLAASGNVVLTQGFIASDANGRTVLLGRGGSDTSAACLAGKLGAERLEIWTDVPGMFTANPRDIPSARLLKRLDYEEAQEIAGTGAKVLHPRCIEPVRRAGIPLVIRYTPKPAMPGTAIGPQSADLGGRVKAISLRRGIQLVEMATSGMWQQVGFLADAFAAFKQHGLSIDLVSTSETTVTVSLDPLANSLDAETVNALLDDLGHHCRARLITGCAAISLVGRQMRANLHRLAPALELFDERRVHLVTQAANDLNFTVVVDEADAGRLARQLHALMILAEGEDEVLGPPWQTLFSPCTDINVETAWWRDARDELLRKASQGTPRYVYHGASLDAAADRVKTLPVERIFFAMKANNNPDVLRRLYAKGLGFECVSPGELAHVRGLFPGIANDRLLFTPNFAPRSDYATALDAGVTITLDNLYALREWPELFREKEILLRVDPGQGAGHHKHVRTAGSHSKFGIPLEELAEAARLGARANARIIGLHAHAGSGIRDPQLWQDVALKLAEAAESFPDVRVLDLGGGLGVPERRGDAPLDMAALAALLAEFRAAHPRFELWLEPGRYLVAEAGALLARVTQLKGKTGAQYVGIDAGMHTLIRPALYGAHHDIVNLSRLDEAASITASVVGPICETGDILGIERRLPECREGDVMLIANAGAYGRVMSSEYNLRGMPDETHL